MKNINKKTATAFLLMASLMLSGCQSGGSDTTENSSQDKQNTTNSSESTTTENASTENSTTEGLTIHYPTYMEDLGFTDPAVLETMPENIVTLVFGVDVILDHLGVDVVGYTPSTIMTYPEGYGDNMESINVNADNFDMETVIALSPDLVILPHTATETYGQICVDADIPIYYVYSGHDKSYDNIRDETKAIAESFATTEADAEAVMQPFYDLEERIETVRPNYEGKTMLVLQSAPPAHYVLADTAVLASMLAMLGLENSYDGSAGGMVPLDFEATIDYEFDYFFATTRSATQEDSQKLMEEDYAKMPE